MSVCFCASVVGCLPQMDGESSSFLTGRYDCIAKCRWMPADEVVLILMVEAGHDETSHGYDLRPIISRSLIQVPWLHAR
jgi:peptidoglycan/xylan/chitin deacetylase (PgdA/CDA1 family)